MYLCDLNRNLLAAGAYKTALFQKGAFGLTPVLNSKVHSATDKKLTTPLLHTLSILKND